MSTRCRIGIQRDDGTIVSIYVHFDGRIENVGSALNEHYTTRAKVEALIALGDLSELGPEIGEKHNFDGPRREGWCCAYGQDREEEGASARVTRACGGWYAYLFTDADEWKVRDFHRSEFAVENLSDALSSMENRP